MVLMDPFTVVQWVVRGVLALVFVGMGVLHLVPRATRVLALMVPPAIGGEPTHTSSQWVAAPRSTRIVHLSGAVAIAAGLALLVPVWGVRFAAGIILIGFLIAVFPANVYAARRSDLFPALQAPLGGRIAVQVLLAILILVAII